MTRTQWRHYQRNKNAGKEALTSQLKLVESSGQKRQYPKGMWVEKGEIMANQTTSMNMDSSGEKGIVSTQSIKCTSLVEDKKEPKYTP